MAEEKDNKTTSPASPAKKTDLVTEIGTLTYPRAVTHFGKDRAIEVMRKVAELGGYGYFEEDQLKSPMFGGLAMPSPEKIQVPRKEDFSHLPEAEFYFQSAVEEHGVNQEQSVTARAAINEYYESLK